MIYIRRIRSGTEAEVIWLPMMNLLWVGVLRLGHYFFDLRVIPELTLHIKDVMNSL